MGVRRILAPIDLSGVSGRALAYAGDLARDLGAGLVVLHVLPRDGAARADARVRVGDFAAWWLGKARDPAPGVEIAVGSPAETIVRQAGSLECDLIVMATHSAKRREGAGLGSVTYEVAATSPAPVLVLRPGPEHSAAIRRILVPTDLSADSSAAIAWAAGLAASVGAGLIVLHVRPGVAAPEATGALREEVEAALLRREVAVDLVVATGEIVDAILGFVHTRPPDLVVVASHRRPGDLRPSVAGQLVERSRVPVAVLHPRLGGGVRGVPAGEASSVR